MWGRYIVSESGKCIARCVRVNARVSVRVCEGEFDIGLVPAILVSFFCFAAGVVVVVVVVLVLVVVLLLFLLLLFFFLCLFVVFSAGACAYADVRIDVTRRNGVRLWYGVFS